MSSREESEYRAELEGSATLAARAERALAGGATHDSWHLHPFPPTFSTASGARKWDISGREYIDFWMGHGSLLLGHAHPNVVRAVEDQLRRGSHFGGAHPTLIEWAERVLRLVPCAERVRFTSSGSEAVQLALRVARAFTGRKRVVRLDGHYHGWHDELLAHVIPDAGSGLNDGSRQMIELVDPFDLDEIDAALDKDVAAVVLEPGGGSSGSLPWSRSHLHDLREITRRRGTLLIFDEVISGFRYAPGGVQELAGVLPDLTALAKILSGGLPGGALVGRADVMGVFGRGIERPHGHARIVHAGTFNGNPLSAAAGVATLDLVADGESQRCADGATKQLVAGINAAAHQRGVDVGAFCTSSTFHLLIGSRSKGIEPAPSIAAVQLMAQQADAHAVLRRCLLLEGVDSHPTHGWLSLAHDDTIIRDAVARFARAFERLPRCEPFQIDAVETCVKVCRMPSCACRERLFAGCDLPIDAGIPAASS